MLRLNPSADYTTFFIFTTVCLSRTDFWDLWQKPSRRHRIWAQAYLGGFSSSSGDEVFWPYCEFFDFIVAEKQDAIAVATPETCLRDR